MSKLIIPLAFILSFLMASCDSSDDIEVQPIRFEQSDYTIRLWITSHISFVNGSGKYELTASNIGDGNVNRFNFQMKSHIFSLIILILK